MTQDKHTALPWKATTRKGSWDWVVYQESDPNIEVCQMFHDGTEFNETGEENTALIIRAVNNHYQLIEVVEKVAALNPEAGEIGDGMLRNLVSLARQALSNAKGGDDE